jgi:hypothetical protein
MDTKNLSLILDDPISNRKENRYNISKSVSRGKERYTPIFCNLEVGRSSNEEGY